MEKVFFLPLLLVLITAVITIFDIDRPSPII